MLHQINHPAAAVRVNIGADNSLGLVQHNVDMRIGATNDTTVHFNFIFFCVHPGGQSIKNNAVHAYARLRH